MLTLRELRADRLLTIRELAQQAGVAPSSIYLIETGRTTPHMSTIRRIASALGVDPKAVTEFQQAIEAAKVAAPSQAPTEQAHRP